jgi:hypothetical protein
VSVQSRRQHGQTSQHKAFSAKTKLMDAPKPLPSNFPALSLKRERFDLHLRASRSSALPSGALQKSSKERFSGFF